MFGRLYDKIDGVLGQPIDAGEVFGVEEAASLILAEILDRASVLISLMALGSVDEMSKDEINMAIHMFKRDCEEARARAERLGLLLESSSWTEAAGERALMEVDESVTVHPYAHAKWRERIGRQVARDSVSACARTTPEAKEESPSPETGE